MFDKLKKPLYFLIIALCVTPFITAPIALLVGLLLAFFKLIPQGIDRNKLSKYLLQISIVLMGFGMNLTQVIQSSKSGFLVTVISVTLTIALGLLIGKLFKVEQNTSTLIATGTAICGGSAIAAVSPVIDAKSNQISFALIVVFSLNAVALLIFPAIGHYFGLSQEAFGYWAAIAIHDTSSVVGASSVYGEKALEIATTVKLTRALWIIPVTIVIAATSKKSGNKKISIPWFIGFFILAILFSNYIQSPDWQSTYTHLSWLGKKGMIVALFIIGSNFNVADIKQAGVKSFLMGVILWIIVTVVSLTIIMHQ